jgi:ABC-2 type transport system ATP-binding protein
MTTLLEASTDAGLAARLQNVTKSYAHFQLKGIHLELTKGTVMGLIGPNGAGKSTIMRILMGLVKPDAGTVSVLGTAISSSEAAAKQEIGYFSDDMRLYKPESVGWHMQFVRSLYPTWDDQYAAGLLHRFGLIEHQAVKGLSHGQRVKAMLLLILARRPKLLILDEPTNGLDPVARHEVLAELMKVVEDENRTVLYSSHNTQDVEQISDTITFIDRGQVISAGNRDEYLDRWKRIRLHVSDDWSVPKLEGLRLESSFRSLRVLSMNQFQDRTAEQIAMSGATIEAIAPMTLEEIFVSTVMRGREGNST